MWNKGKCEEWIMHYLFRVCNYYCLKTWKFSDLGQVKITDTHCDIRFNYFTQLKCSTPSYKIIDNFFDNCFLVERNPVIGDSIFIQQKVCDLLFSCSHKEVMIHAFHFFNKIFKKMNICRMSYSKENLQLFSWHLCVLARGNKFFNTTKSIPARLARRS